MAEFSELPELETIHSTDSESEPTETYNDSSEIPASESSATSQVKNFLNQFQSRRWSELVWKQKNSSQST